MAAMTPATVRARIMTLVEASSPGLIRAQEAFSLALQPNTLVDYSYTIAQELIKEASQTASVTARLERVTVVVGWLLKQDSEAAVRALEVVLTDVDRRVRADGVSQGYHVWPISQTITRPEGRDYCLGTLAWTCDYDFSEAVA